MGAHQSNNNTENNRKDTSSPLSANSYFAPNSSVALRKSSLESIDLPISSVLHRSTAISALAAAYANKGGNNVNNSTNIPKQVALKASSHPNLSTIARFSKYPPNRNDSSSIHRASTPHRTAAGIRRIRSATSFPAIDSLEFTICRNCQGNCVGKVLSPAGDLFCSGDCYFSFAFRQAEANFTTSLHDSHKSHKQENDEYTENHKNMDDSGFASAAGGVKDSFNEADEDHYFNLRRLQKNYKIFNPGNETISNPIAIPDLHLSPAPVDINSILYS